MNNNINPNDQDQKELKIQQFLQDIPLLRATMAFNSMVIISPYAESTAIRTGDLIYRSFPYLEQNRIAELYMLNSKSSRHKFDDMIGVNLFKTQPAIVSAIKNEERVILKENMTKLPDTSAIKRSVGTAIMNRRSHRKFVKNSIPFDRIANILSYANGVSVKVPIKEIGLNYLNPIDIKLRTAPSAGGMYPVDIYLIALNVSGLEKGVYLYSPVDQGMIHINLDDLIYDKITSCYVTGKDVLQFDGVSFVLVLVGKLWKILRKYGNRGLRFMFIEAGEISENIHLVGQSTGVGTSDIAGFYDSELEKILGIDGINEHILNTIVCGIPQS